jgi:hypothetical protein
VNDSCSFPTAPTNIPSDPKGLQLVLEYLKETYGNLPIYVQENLIISVLCKELADPVIFAMQCTSIGLYVLNWIKRLENIIKTLETDIIRLIITFKMIFIGLQDAPTNVPSDPKGLQLVLEYLDETYGNLPIYVQENGKRNSQLEASLS